MHAISEMCGCNNLFDKLKASILMPLIAKYLYKYNGNDVLTQTDNALAYIATLPTYNHDGTSYNLYELLCGGSSMYDFDVDGGGIITVGAILNLKYEVSIDDLELIDDILCKCAFEYANGWPYVKANKHGIITKASIKHANLLKRKYGIGC